MYPEENRTLPITPEWSAEFVFIYLMSNSSNGWGLVLHGPDGKKVDRFKDYIDHCSSTGDSDEQLMSRLSLSDDQLQLTIRTRYEGDWRVDLETGDLRKLPPTAEELRQNALEEAHRRAWEEEAGDLTEPGDLSYEERVKRGKKRGCGCFLILLGGFLLGKLLWMILQTR